MERVGDEMHDQRPYRVQHYISTDLEQMTLVLNKNRFVSSLGKVPNAPRLLEGML
jgi:hypothetical protein